MKSFKICFHSFNRFCKQFVHVCLCVCLYADMYMYAQCKAASLCLFCQHARSRSTFSHSTCTELVFAVGNFKIYQKPSNAVTSIKCLNRIKMNWLNNGHMNLCDMSTSAACMRPHPTACSLSIYLPVYISL